MISGPGTSTNNNVNNNKMMRVAFLPSDAFYKNLSPKDKEKAFRNEYDFDHPSSIAWDELLECLKKLTTTNDPVQLPQYDFATHSRLGPEFTTDVGPADVIIVEGILIYAAGNKKLRDVLDLKVYVDCDSDMCLARRVLRDTRERGRATEGVLQQYLKFVRPSQINFVEPSKRYADVIIPNHNGGDVSEVEKNCCEKSSGPTSKNPLKPNLSSVSAASNNDFSSCSKNSRSANGNKSQCTTSVTVEAGASANGHNPDLYEATEDESSCVDTFKISRDGGNIRNSNATQMLIHHIKHQLKIRE